MKLYTLAIIKIAYNLSIRSLARLLPFMVGDIILTDDEHWLNFLALLTTIDYVFAPVVSPDIVAFLHDKICSHHETF